MDDIVKDVNDGWDQQGATGGMQYVLSPLVPCLSPFCCIFASRNMRVLMRAFLLASKAVMIIYGKRYVLHEAYHLYEADS